MGKPAAPSIDAAGLTDLGKRRKANEDAFLVGSLRRSLVVEETSLEPGDDSWLASGGAEGSVLVVADGMGGQGGGHIASRVAVRSIADYVCNVMPWAARMAEQAVSPRATIPGVREQLSTALATGDTEVRQAVDLPGANPNMGTTLTLAYLLWPRLYVAHVGDSRCYVFRGNRLMRLTTDHTVAEQMKEQGFPALDESSPLHHVLWNSLGATEEEIMPEVKRTTVFPGDSVLLCTDGLTKHVSAEEIAKCLAKGESAKECCKILVDLANQRGGTDNVTVVIARVGAMGSQS